MARVLDVGPSRSGRTLVGGASLSAVPAAQRVTVRDEAACSATPAIEVRLLEAPVTTDRFELRRPLGEGGMAVVELVRDRSLERDVAAKRMRGEGDERLTSLFMREARIAARLEHPNIVPIHDVGIDTCGRPVVYMKAIEGTSLADVIERLRNQETKTVVEVTIERRLEIFIGVLRALEHAHAHGVQHRDLKPENIMLGAHGEIVLVDWGVASAAGEPDVIPEGAVVGTPMYMAPEQACGECSDPRSDLYAAGVVLHELLRLRHHLGEGDEEPEVIMRRVATDGWRWSLLDWHRPGTEPMPPMELYHFLRKAMAHDPRRRFQSATEMIREIARILDGRIRVQCHITLVKSSVRRIGRVVDRFPWLSFVAFASGVGFATYGGYALFEPLLR